MFIYSQREKFNQTTSTANQEIYRADAHKQKMETLAADLQMKKTAEKKRLENENNFRRQNSWLGEKIGRTRFFFSLCVFLPHCFNY